MKPHESNNRRSILIRPVVTGAVVGLLVFFLVEPIGYLIHPNDSLFTEAGWKSYSDDRSKRIDFLLWYGADPNAYVQRGYTSFHTAVQWESLNSATQLLNAGADVNLLTDSVQHARSALDIACVYSQKSFEVIEVLVARGGVRTRSHPVNLQGVPNPPVCYD